MEKGNKRKKRDEITSRGKTGMAFARS